MRKYLLIFTILAISSSAKILTMQTCIDKALDTHPDIKGFILEVSKSEQSAISARSGYLPHINLQAEYDFQRTYVLPQNGQFNTIDDKGWQVGVTAQQKIWDFGKTSSKTQSAKIQSEISRLSVQEAKKLIVYKIQSLYASILVQKEMIAVRQKDMQTKKALYDQALAFVDQGLKTTSDATRFLSSFYAANDALYVAQSSYKKAVSSLSLYIAEQIVPDTEFENIFAQERPVSSSDFSDLQQALLANNTQLQTYAKIIEKSKLQRKEAQAAHYGSFDAVASYTQMDTLNSYDTKQIGITFNMPLYSGSDISAQSQMASIAVNAAKQSKASALLQLQDELNALFIDLGQYENTIDAKKAQLTSALSTKALINGRYKEGLATYIEVLDATALYLDAELELLQAHFNRTMTQNRLHYLTGEPL